MRFFVSFARADVARVSDLARILEEDGHDVWFDRKLLPGVSWKLQIKDQIRQCDALIFAVSPDSVASTWCLFEYREALRSARPVVPVRFHPGTEIPEFLSELHCPDLSAGFDPASAVRFVRQLRSAIDWAVAHISAEVPTETEPEGAPAQAFERLENGSRSLQEVPTSPLEELDGHDLLAELYEIREEDPERALLLLEEIRRSRPDLMGAKSSELFARLEQTLKPLRIRNFREQAEAMIRSREWGEAETLARRMVSIEPAETPFLLSVLRSRAIHLAGIGDWEGAEAAALDDLLLRADLTVPLGAWWTLEASGLSETDPDLQSLARAFARISQKNREFLLEILDQEARAMMQTGRWREAGKTGRKMLLVDDRSVTGRRFLEDSARNEQYDPYYRNAVQFLRQGREKAALSLLKDLRDACPSYGDPRGLLAGQPITSHFALWLRTVRDVVLPKRITAWAFEPSSRRLFLAQDKGLYLIRPLSQEEPPQIAVALENCIDLGLYPAQNLIVMASTTSFQVLDLSSGERLYEAPRPEQIAFAPDLELLAQANLTSVTVIEIRSGQPTRAPLHTQDGVEIIASDWSGSFLAVASLDAIKVRRTVNLTRVARFNLEPPVTKPAALAVAPSAVAAMGDDKIAVWRRREESFERKPLLITPAEAKPTALGLTPDGQLLATGGNDGITLWDLNNGNPLHRLPVRGTWGVKKLSFSSDGSLLAAGLENGTLQIWGLTDRETPDFEVLGD